MAKGQQKSNREGKKKAVLTLKEKRAAKRDKDRPAAFLIQKPQKHGD
ncbi:MAG: hypothetical protein WD750_12010 [Gammaproteobacteria bacterium]